MSLQEEKINREIKRLVDVKRLIQSCDCVAFIREKEETASYFLKQDDEEKDIICLMMSGINEKIQKLIAERDKIREEQQNDRHSESN